MIQTLITWDLGATKCTAGLIEYNSVTQELSCIRDFTIKLVDTSSLENLINEIESGLNFSMADADAICIGAAGQYDGKYLQHTNPYPYPMHFANTAKLQKWPPFAVIHDYASIVCATFTSYMEDPENIKRLNSCSIKLHGRRVALGIGTGLGLKDGVLFPDGDFWLGQNEMGHIGITYPPLADKKHLQRHESLMHFLQSKNENSAPITYEKILTGKGTANLYEFFYEDSKGITPEEVSEKLHEGKAKEMLDTFAWYAGLFVGTVQLTFLPEGGVWITGGVVMKNLQIFDSPEFLAGIYASPAYLMQREEFALGVMCNHEHALIGSGYYAVKRLLV